MLFPYGIIMNYLTTLNHHDFWNNKTTRSTSTLHWKASAKVMMWQSHTAISKVHQNPGVCFFMPLSGISATFLSWSNFSKRPRWRETLPCSGGPRGNPRAKEKKVRHLDSFFPKQLSVGLYYVCKAKSWSEKTMYYRILNINTTLKYFYFVI